MSIATARTWAQRTGPSSSKNGLISALERPRPTHSTRLRSGSTTTVAYRWPFWIANSSIASSRTPSRFGGPSERSRCRKSIALTVFQSSPNHRAVCRTDVPAHSRATLSASRRVTRAWGSSQSSRSSLGPQRGQARRSRGTHNSTAYSNSGRSRIRRTVWSWMAATGWSQPEQRRSAPPTGASSSTAQDWPPRSS